jgi:hypothetical protein
MPLMANEHIMLPALISNRFHNILEIVFISSS